MSVRTADRRIIQTGKATFHQPRLSTTRSEQVTITSSPQGVDSKTMCSACVPVTGISRIQTPVGEISFSTQKKRHKLDEHA